MKRHGCSAVHLVALILACWTASAAHAKSDAGPHGLGVDVMVGLFGSVESENLPEPDDLEGPFILSLDYEHRLVPWLYVGPRLIWSLSESVDSDHDYSNGHLGLQVLPTWSVHQKVHLFGLTSVGGSYVNRNDGGRDRTGWGTHFMVGVGAKLLLRGMHLRMTLNHLVTFVEQIESEEPVGPPFTDSGLRLSHTSLGLGCVF